MARYGDKTEVSATAIRDLATALARIHQKIGDVANAMDAHGLESVAATNLISGMDGFEQISKLAAALEHGLVYGLGTRSIKLASSRVDYPLGSGEALNVAEVAATFAKEPTIVGPTTLSRSKKKKKKS